MLVLLSGASRMPCSHYAMLYALIGVSSAEQIVQITVKDQPHVCLDVYGGKADDGAKIDVWTCGGGKGQTFYFDPGTFKIRSVLDETKCIDAGDMKPGTPLLLKACDVQTNQFWGFDSQTSTIFLYKSTADASICMDVKDAVFKEGTAVQNWNCDGHSSQSWVVSAPPPPAQLFQISVHGQNLCLDLYSGKTDNGTPIDVWACSDDAKGQQWIFQTGSFKIQSALDPRKCIDAADMKVRSQLRIWDCDGLGHQKWGYDFKQETIYLAAGETDAANCMCLTDYKNGAPIQLYSCNDQGTEKWRFTSISGADSYLRPAVVV